jgi:hypothetical protein
MFFYSHTIACYTREQVKREEKEILGHQQPLFIYIFVCHPRTIIHASIYHLNLYPWSYAPSTIPVSIQPRHNIRRRNTSYHVLILSQSFLITSTPLPVHYVPLEPSSPLAPIEWHSHSPFLHTFLPTSTGMTPCRLDPLGRNSRLIGLQYGHSAFISVCRVVYYPVGAVGKSLPIIL